MEKQIKFILLFLLLFFLTSCSTTTTTAIKRYRDFNHIDHWDQVESLTGTTLILYYSPYCEICKSIEAEVAPALAFLAEAGYTVFLINEGFIYEQGTPPLELIEVPSILVYQNHELDEKISGSIPILRYLESKLQESAGQ